jgi:diadenosine tetraphosphatase ApaH/serine/threonine PP2A family protein phosphatase
VKLFICSDVHGNLRAFDVALEAYREHSPCRLLFLGDAVGYGAHPDACLDRLLALPRSNLVLGNHDWAVLDVSEREHFHAAAFTAIEWTVKALKGKYNDPLLKRFDLTVRNSEFLAAHGSPVHPEEFTYIFSMYEAENAFNASDFSLCFVGHTHVPMVYNLTGGPKSLEPGEPLALDPSGRYIINPGSVGQPRDGDNRAAFMIYDPEERTVTLHRREYDIEAEAKEIIEAGLPPYFAERLTAGG